MKRRVLLLTNPGKQGAPNYCSGVYKDQENYFSYFKEPFGGYWSNSELKHLDKPSCSTVRGELSLLFQEDIEFSIIIFCGHGWYSSKSNSNILILNDGGEEMDSLELRVNANKRIIILDSCRKVSPEYINESLTKSLSAKAIFESERSLLNPEECKKYYNKAISECPKQIINSYACNLNEVAGDNPVFGGYYSSSLIKASKDWVDAKQKYLDLSTTFSVERFPRCHDASTPLVSRLSGGTQNPTIEKPRVSDVKDYLPFVVIA